MSTVVRSMRSPLGRATVLLGTALLAAGCAAQPGGSSAAPRTTPDATLPDDGGLVVQVAYTDGFVAPRYTYARLPLVSVYADGRVITEGPVAAVYPGPALPNVQVAQVAPAQVEQVVQHALDAGVGLDVDYGMPPVADVPNTRFTVVTDEGTRTSEVYALQEGLFPADQDVPGLTDQQLADRRRLQELVDEATALGADSRPYEPEAVVAVAGTDLPAGASPDDVATWPGPPLPGDELSTGLGLFCVAARGEAATAVLDAAAGATTATVWRNPDGGRWALTVRPLLPHETGCADLPRV